MPDTIVFTIIGAAGGGALLLIVTTIIICALIMKKYHSTSVESQSTLLVFVSLGLYPVTCKSIVVYYSELLHCMFSAT